MSENGVIISQDPQLLQALKLVRRVARFGSTLMLIGESGTGKDLIAGYFHKNSKRKDGKFVTVDCASIPSELIESALFGHEKGAFTGAVKQKEGFFETAHGGTIYLDQVDSLPLHIQSKLTRVLQEKAFERVGGTETIHVDVQIVSATRNDLAKQIQKGTFREDLYFRLSIVPVHLPPLRMRQADIPLLIKHFLEKFARKYNRETPRIQHQTLELLCNHNWPGNVRELENLMERLIISFKDSDTIQIDALPKQLESISSDTLDFFAEQNLTLEQLEKIYIQRILKKTKGNKSKAADILGINRKTLLEKRKRYHLN